MRLKLLPSTFAVCRLDAAAAVPQWAQGDFVSITRTADELSIVCDDSRVPRGVVAERDWRCLALEGPIPFEVVGVAARLTNALAEAGISLLFVATYDTDYVLIRSSSLGGATAALRAAEFDF